MKKSAKLSSAFFLITLLMTGCATVTFSPQKISQPVLMNDKIGKDYTVLKHFNKEHTLWWFLWGLAPVEQVDLFYLVNNELKASQGDAIINLRIDGRNDFLEEVVPLLTFGLLYGRTYSLSGDIIKFKTP